MAKLIYSNVIGTFLFDGQKLVEEKLFSKKEIFPNSNLMVEGKFDSELAAKHPDADIVKGIAPEWVLDFFNQPKYFNQMKDATMLVTKRLIAGSVKGDNLIAQAVSNVDDIDRVANNLCKRLREWYELYNPEFSTSIEDHEKFTELIQKKTKQELLEEINMTVFESMGADIDKKDLEPMMELAKEISALFDLRERQAKYIERCMNDQLPNVSAVAGALIGAKLLAIAGSLQKLAMFPASTIQLLGAEKALFRHIKTGARPPKYGVIINHPLVTKAPHADKGKTARMLADKISIAAKIDFFKGEFRGDQLRQELEKKLK